MIRFVIVVIIIVVILLILLASIAVCVRSQKSVFSKKHLVKRELERVVSRVSKTTAFCILL